MRVLITGAAGGVGTVLRTGLAEAGWTVRGLDLVLPDDTAGNADPAANDETEWVRADIADVEALVEAMRDVDAVIHLAGLPTENTFHLIRAANIDGTHNVFEAARLAKVPRVLYASSNHAVGYHQREDHPDGIGVDVRPRPDTFYGVSKVFGEAIASYYHDRHGIAVACVRIGSCFPSPRTVRMLETWLSPADAVRLFHTLLTTPDLGYEIVYGVSANTRGWMDLAPARRLGYEPQDDAEVYREATEAELGGLDHDDPEYVYLGGAFTTRVPPQ